jgi:ribosomal-protein-alanine N-acetyltransferase
MPNVPDRDILTPRLRLEPLTAEHAPRLFPVLSDPTIYTYTPGEPPGSVESLRERYERLQRRVSPSGEELWLNWAVWLEASRRYAGVVQATVRRERSALIAYELGEPFRGAGYATEACEAMIAALASDYSVERVRAHVDTRNLASIRLLERLGFRRVDLIRNADHFKGASSDELVYARDLI